MNIETNSCPVWYTDHTGFDVGSDDWHQGAEREAGGHTVYLSTGTLTGEVAVFHARDPSEGISLNAAEAFARVLLTAVEEARA